MLCACLESAELLELESALSFSVLSPYLSLILLHRGRLKKEGIPHILFVMWTKLPTGIPSANPAKWDSISGSLRDN